MEGEEAVSEEVVIPVEGEEVIAPVEGTEEVPVDESGEVPAEGEEEPAEGEEEPAEEVDLTDMKYGDMDIKVEIPTEVDTMLKDAGFNAAELTKELYADGEISLPQETMDALYQQFGQFQVDNYLAGLKSAAQLLSYTVKEESAKVDAANQEAWDAALDIVGSEEGWDNIEAWLQLPESSDVISNAELEQFNKLMNGGDSYTQKLAIDSLNSRYRATLSPEEQELTLIEGNQGNGGDVKTMLSSNDFHDLITSGKYGKADITQRREWDTLRQKGINKGI